MDGHLEARDLRLVQAIAEAGGATRAARRLHLSQSAVSHQLRGLEDRLGVALFRRDGRKLVITTAGLRLVELGSPVLAQLRQAEIELRRSSLNERTQLHVAAQCYTAYHWLPKALLALTADHPEVELVLSSEVLGDALEGFQDKRLDLALCVQPPERTGFKRVPLFEDELVLAVPRGHALARKPFIDGRDLANETLIQTNVSSAERDRVLKVLFGSSPPKVGRVLRLPLAEAVLDLVQAGLGVSILPGFALSARLARGEIQTVRLSRRGLPRSWTGVFRKASPLTAPILTLLDQLKRSGSGLT
jgi:LysR family transcriptional regulator for metE and metH